MENGFILISRNIIDSDVFASQKLLKIWIWCLCRANYKDRTIPLNIGRGETIVKIKRGSFLFGRHKAEEELFIDGSTIYKSMKKLEELKMIKINSNNQYSVVTICNYDNYQQAKNYKVTGKEQPSNNQVTGKEQPSNTDNNDNKDKNDNNNKELFDNFRKKYPGTRRGLDVEYKELKKHSDYKTVITLLESALNKEIEHKLKLQSVGQFVPKWKNLKTWLNQRCWEQEFETFERPQKKLVM
jgi:hypothetical protein